jgi:hypothetical protein
MKINIRSAFYIIIFIIKIYIYLLLLFIKTIRNFLKKENIIFIIK